MSRSATAVITLLTMTLGPAPATAQVGGAGVGQGAFAHWIFIRGDRGTSFSQRIRLQAA